MVFKKLANYVFPWYETEKGKYERGLNIVNIGLVLTASAGIGFLVSRLISNESAINSMSSILSAGIMKDFLILYTLIGDRYRRLNQNAVEPTHPDHILLLKRLRRLNEQDGVVIDRRQPRERLAGVILHRGINYHTYHPLSL